jgi:class 3 adenylate cyclase/tetratricopeptide (TPR) repeat protein
MAASDERKPVTVLFADLAGSTELATRHDPEQLRALLAAFFDEMRQQIEAFGGTVEKYAGDAIMAVFGVPRVGEDDAERAVRAAVAMRGSLDQLNPMFEQEYGVRLSLRVGIATGEAVATTGAVNDFMVTGEVANLAARLQTAGSGVVLSEETYHLLQPLLEAETLPPLDLKGFPRPMTAYLLRALRPIESRPRGVPGLSSPVVGRDREVAALRSCVDELRRGRGQVVFLVGEAGIGKTRLKIDLRESLPDGIRWLEGRCQSYTQSTSYAPMVQVLRSLTGLGTAEPAPIARAKLRAALRVLAGPRAEQVQPALAHLLGVELGSGQPAVPADARSLQSELVLAMRVLLEGLASRDAVILAVEDLHWADVASIELLTLLLELTDLLPLMILLTTRPESDADAWSLRFHAERNYPHRVTEIRLPPLAHEDSERLADNLLRVSDLPEGLRARVLERAEGNPFFLEEILRTLIEEGVLRREGERWVATAEPERTLVPTTLRGVLAARIDRLPAPAKLMLQRASVAGRFFTYRALAALAEPGEDLDRALAHLLRAELVREWARLPERQYVFKHALTQDAAAASLLAEPRKALHAAVARHLEETGADLSAEHAPVLAHHWYEAAEWERALHYALRAAERARALYARPEAVGHHWRALELLGRLPSTRERRRLSATVVIELVQLPGWIKSRQLLEEGLRHLRGAMETGVELRDPDLLACAEGLQGGITRDEAALTRAVERARSEGQPSTQAFTAERYGYYLGACGRWEESLVQFSRAIEIHGAVGARHQQAIDISAGGRCWNARAGRLEESLQYAAQFRSIAAELGDTRLLAWRAMEAEPYIYMGRWEDAVRVAEESLPIAWEIGEDTVMLFVSAWLAQAYLKLGRFDDARRVIVRALQWSEGHINAVPFSLSYTSVARVLVHLADGELPEALARARTAVRLAEQSQFRLEMGASHRALGMAHEASGEREDAEHAYRTSLEILGDDRPRPEFGQTLLAYGRFKRGDDAAEGRRLLERARALFAVIGASGWVAEADAALSSHGGPSDEPV